MSEKTKISFSGDEEDPSLPETVFNQYKTGTQFKSSIGDSGMYEQVKKNERFFIGDQWNGLAALNQVKPKHNVIKRIGEYKISNIVSNPVTAVFSFEGVPNCIDINEPLEAKQIVEKMTAVTKKVNAAEAANSAEQKTSDSSNQDNEQKSSGLVPIDYGTELRCVSDALTAHFKSTWERLKMDKKTQTGAKKAYISGAFVLYSYWDGTIKTGQYADYDRKTEITGDIDCEILDITNVYFGEPTEVSVQDQPYIIIAQRKSADELKREAKNNGISQDEIDQIDNDNDTSYSAGNQNDNDNSYYKKATVLTKLWKEYDDSGNFKIMAVKVTQNATVKEAWDIGLPIYPLAIFQWDETDNNIYGHSEVTELIPNQIAINKMRAFEILAMMYMGIPKIIYNEDVITQTITNNPGEIIKIRGNNSDVQNAFRFVNPAQVSPNWDTAQQSMIDNSMSLAGATDTALGDVRPDNTSAIIAVREAAALPLQPILTRYYSFVEDIAEIWATMFIYLYGKRSLKIEENGSTYYAPFDGDRYKDMVLSVNIDVGQSSIWSVSTVISTLDKLLQSGIITPSQYVERIPDGFIPNRQALLRYLQQKEEQQQQLAIQQATQTSNTGQAQQTNQNSGQASQSSQGQQPMNLDEMLSQLSPDELQAANENPNVVYDNLKDVLPQQ